MTKSVPFALLLMLAACGRAELETLNVEGRAYAVPSGHISSLTREPHVFLRVKPPETRFSLVYDSRAVGAQSGPGVPRIFSVNDEGQTGVEYHQRGESLVVCRKAVHPNGGCGTMVDHDGAQWAVLFPLERLPEAEKLAREAVAMLDEYSA